jgi:hypothetical protein
MITLFILRYNHNIGLWDRCFDFNNIFAEHFGEKWRFYSIYLLLVMQNMHHKFGF